MIKIGVRYDSEYIKRPLAVGEYTPEMLVELDTCSESPLPFVKHVVIVHPDRGKIPFDPYPFQMEVLKTIINNRFVIILCARQAGKSTTIAAYALWFAIFHPDKTVGIVSNKAVSAIDILHRIKIMYEELPNWIKPGVEEYSKTFITFDNKSRIFVSATTPDAFRGRTLNLLFCDEFAFVKKSICEDFWSANYPTISTSEDAKIIIVSTPNGMFNLFHKLYVDAEHLENTFIPLKYDWKAVPGRDQAWALEQRRNLGKIRFAQEQLVEFIGSIATVIDSNVLEILFQQCNDPNYLELEGKLKIWEKPEKQATYVLGCDTAKGTGENFSCVQVLRIDSMTPYKCTQVAVYMDNHVDVYTFADIINRIAIYYNKAFIMCENNAEGSAVVGKLWWDLENGGLVNSGAKNKDLGLRATRKTKPKAVLLMKKLIEDGELVLNDKETVNQLTTFIEKNGKYFGKENSDDLVSALYWAVFIVEMNVLAEGYELKRWDEGKEEDEVWGIMSDIIDNIDDDFSWLTGGPQLWD